MTGTHDPAFRSPGAPHRRNRKARDRSIALLLVGIVLLMPPIGAIFRINTDAFGLPFPLLYIFVVWVFLIVGGTLLAKPLLDSENEPPAPGAGDGDG